MVTLHDTFNPDADGFLVDVFDEDGNLIDSSFVEISPTREFDDETLLQLNDLDTALATMRTPALV